MFNSGDIAFMILSSALVLLMTPGLAFFYGGLVGRKNVLNTMMSSIFLMGVATLLWVTVGYSLCFGGNLFGIIGDLRYFGLTNVSMEPSPYASNLPHLLFVCFQMMFAIITPALITGSISGRMKFKALFFFSILWSLLVYYPIAHMVWGQGGFLAKLGAVDFAGGNVVHISSGVSALLLAILLGKRKGHAKVNYHPHNIPFVLLGGCLLWFGWFGFNAGSALSSGTLAVHAFLTTHISAASAMLSWMLLDYLRDKKPTVIGAITGAVVGLVAITPGCGFVPIWAAMLIGLLVSPICYFSVTVLKKKFGYDDALDAFGCHGIGGIWGGIATGLFAEKSINPVAQWDGLFFGDTRLFLAQLLSIVVTIVVALLGTLISIGIVRFITKLRVSEREEVVGLDTSEHGESAYPSFNGMD